MGSLRQQVQVGSFLLIMTLALAVGTLWSVGNAARVREDAGTALLQTAHEMADRLSREMAARARDVSLLAQIDMFRDANDPAAMRASLDALRNTLPTYAWIGVTDPRGRVIAGTDGVLVGESIAARPVFAHGREGLWTGDVHEAVMLARLAPHRPGEAMKFVDVAAPIHSTDQSFRGVLALHMSWQWAADLRDAVLKPYGGVASLHMLVLGADGGVLLAPESPGRTDAGRAAAVANLAPAALQRLDERWGSERWSDGVQAISAMAESRASGDFKGFGWRVLVRDDSAAREVAATRDAHEIWVRSLGAGVAAAIVSWCLIGWAMAPVDRLTHALDEEAAESEQVAMQPGQAPAPRKHTARRNDIHQIATRISELQEALQQQHVAMRDLEHIAHHDELTGLFNRAYLTQLMAKLEEDASTVTMEMCVLCLDLDRFKPINDEYGHAAGDDVLKQVAARLRQAARDEDFVLRLGGDEFLILLPCPPGEGVKIAELIATRILVDLQRPMSHPTIPDLQIGGSIGAAIWRQRGMTLATTVAQADQALFAAKRAGRGRFRHYVSCLAAKELTPSTAEPAAPLHSA